MLNLDLSGAPLRLENHSTIRRATRKTLLLRGQDTACSCRGGGAGRTAS